MLSFFTPPVIGIEIASTVLRLGVICRNGSGPSLQAARTIDIPAGTVNETYAPPAIADPEQFTELLRAGLGGFAPSGTKRVGLSLPDAMFRIQILEFDDLPKAEPDRERLIRWRLEKSGAFDISGTALRFQVQQRSDRGYTVLAAVAKQGLIASFEEILSGLGFEVWIILPASFAALNFYAAYLAGKSGMYALVLLSGGSYSTIIVEGGMPRFYRFREIKAAGRDEILARLVRELNDSLHFYMHRDRQQLSEVGHLFVAGDPGMIDGLSDALRSRTTLEIERLSPRSVISSLNNDQELLAAALGAGGLR